MKGRLVIGLLCMFVLPFIIPTVFSAVLAMLGLGRVWELSPGWILVAYVPWAIGVASCFVLPIPMLLRVLVVILYSPLALVAYMYVALLSVCFFGLDCLLNFTFALCACEVDRRAHKADFAITLKGHFILDAGDFVR